MSKSFVACTDAAAVDARLRSFYGDVDWSAARGILHVAAVTERARGRVVLVPGDAAPSSAIDRFVLGAARARADAIVTTGAILRGEPDLSHAASDDEAEDRAFRVWRRERLGKRAEPLLVVLTASGDLPIHHSALRSATRGFVSTTIEGAARLRARCGDSVHALEVLASARDRSGLEGALERLESIPDVHTVLIEAGPEASAPLYAMRSKAPEAARPDRVRLDELLLDEFRGAVAEAGRGPAFFAPAEIDRVFTRPPSVRSLEDDSGHWIVSRYTRFEGGREGTR